MKRVWLVLALTAVTFSSSTAWADWIYPGPRVRAYYAAPVVVVRPRPYVWAAPAPVYYAPPVYAAPVYAAPVYAPPMYSTAYPSPSVYSAAPIYSPAPVYAAPVVTPRRVYYPGEPIRNAVKFVVP